MLSAIPEPADELRQAYRGRRVCVTGGAGFIGSHLVDALADLGAEVVVIDDLSSGLRENLSSAARLVEGSILDEDAIREATRGCAVIFHEAALTSVPGSVEEPTRYYGVNATGTQSVLEAARKLEGGPPRVVYAASSSAYGIRDETVLRETLVPLPSSPYAAAKCAGEFLLSAYAACYGLSGISLRYFNIFGPRQRPDSPYAAVIPRFAEALIEGKRPVIYGDGLQTRDFTHVANVVYANLLAGAAPRALGGEVVNVACGHRFDLLGLLKLMAQRLGTPSDHDLAPPRVGEIRHSEADISRARELIGYRPIVGFEEGLDDTLAFFTRSESPR
ncbi:MAG: NAD-dependent epimerase/dehydratase family protein [Planctomycetota bacterium]